MERKYNIDALRVAVFCLLIFYHAGMFFVPWGWHIKNNEIVDWIRWPMLFLNQWRLPILFLISGMGTYYALGKRTSGEFARERILRLLIPLLFGIFFIVPPQIYIERLVDGDFVGSYLQFWPAKIFTGIYPTGNFSWHHLWFLPYLLIYSLLLIPIFLRVRNRPSSYLSRLSISLSTSPFKLYFFVLPIYLSEAFLEPFFPETHAFIGDWYLVTYYLFFFLSGFLLVHSGNTLWEVLAHNRKKFLSAAVLAFVLQLYIWLAVEDSTLVHFIEAAIKVINIWSWILVLLGYSFVYMNTPKKWLTYANQAVYPYYILHQTITLIVAYFIKDLSWAFGVKFSLLVGTTFLFSGLIYEFLIRRIPLLQPLFGIKRIK